MKKEIECINRIFESNVTVKDCSSHIEDVLDWDSFMIMRFMTDMSEQYQVTITIEQISEIETLEDLIELVGKYVKEE